MDEKSASPTRTRLGFVADVAVCQISAKLVLSKSIISGFARHSTTILKPHASTCSKPNNGTEAESVAETTTARAVETNRTCGT
jgi:hypothetical protein